MVTNKGEQIVRRSLRRHVVAVFGKKFCQFFCRLLPGNKADAGFRETEIEYWRHSWLMHDLGKHSRVIVEKLGKNPKIFPLPRFGSRSNSWHKLLPKLWVHVLEGIQAHACQIEASYPILVDVDHSLDDAWLFGEQVVQTRNISVLRAFAGASYISSVMIYCGVV